MCHCFLDLFLNLLANWAVNIDQAIGKKGDLLRDGKAITRFGLDWLAGDRSRNKYPRTHCWSKTWSFPEKRYVLMA